MNKKLLKFNMVSLAIFVFLIYSGIDYVWQFGMHYTHYGFYSVPVLNFINVILMSPVVFGFLWIYSFVFGLINPYVEYYRVIRTLNKS